MDAQPTPRLRTFENQDIRAPSLASLRAELKERIITLCEAPMERENARAAVLDLLRTALDQGRAVARAALEAGGKGLACASFLSRT